MSQLPKMASEIKAKKERVKHENFQYRVAKAGNIIYT